LAVLSLLLTLWQWIGSRYPLHQRIGAHPFAPDLTLLKPLKGVDDHTEECLRSWFTQAYPGKMQLLFGVASPDDPVCDVVRRLVGEHPEAHAKLVICHETLGFNAKVSSLIQLRRLAENEIIVVSDADVLAPKDFLKNAVAPLTDPEVGLVNCFYRLANPATLAMRWKAIAINADFWSQVLQSKDLAPLDFALGAVMITRRAHLQEIGGFEALADHLADDFQLGNRIVRIGGRRIVLCPVVVDCLSEPLSWGDTWRHQLRWARTIRVSRPLPYAFSILSNATLWPLLWMATQPTPLSLLTFAGCISLRIVMVQTLQRRLGAVVGQWRFWWLAPIKDLLQCGLWAGAFLGNHITWRGQKYRLLRDGRLAAH
jgi:ceramide glucosyltransferase